MVRAGPPPGSLEPRPRDQAVLMRLKPKPGMFTHMSRGMESIPAVFLSGSTVIRINVSVQKGQSPSRGSPPRSPTNRMLIRLAPSQVGYALSSGTGSSGVELGTAVPGARTKPSGEVIGPFVQFAGTVPGREVSRQQAVKSRTNVKRPAAITRANPQKIRLRIGKRPKLISGMKMFSHEPGEFTHLWSQRLVL